jgi:hypothetical protein
MDSHDSAASVYSEAKGEYTKQLTLFIVPVFHRFFMTNLQQASEEEPQAKRQLWKFQELLSQIPEWNVDKVQRETSKIVGDIQCDYLEELVTAVFIAHTKVLTAIRIGNKNKRVQITIPKLDHFIHRSLSECSRLLWSSAYLFHSDLSPIDKQKNHRQIEQLLHEGIAQAIRGLLPVKNILKDYLSEGADTGDADDEDDDEKKDEKSEEKVEEKSEKKDEVPAVPDIPVIPDVSDIPEVPELSDVPAVPAVPTPEVPTVPAVPVVPVVPVVPIVKIPEVPAEVKIPEVPAVKEIQTLVVETEPSVRFTDFNQVIQNRPGETQIDYVETNHEPKTDELEFLDDSSEPLSDFEDITELETIPMTSGDFETLP